MPAMILSYIVGLRFTAGSSESISPSWNQRCAVFSASRYCECTACFTVVPPSS